VSLVRGALVESVSVVEVRATDDDEVAVLFGDGTDWVELGGKLVDVMALIVAADNELGRRGRPRPLL